MKFHTFDLEYVRLLTDGDPEVERHFTAYFGELLLIKLRSRLRSPQLIEEARQETFLRVLTVLRQRGGLEHPERLGAFVSSVCNNVLFEFYRAESRTSPLPESGFDITDGRASPESELVSDERKRQVAQVLRDMPPKHRDLLRMIFLEEKDKAEVCKELNVDRDYLRVLLHRAKSCFRTDYLKQRSATLGG